MAKLLGSVFAAIADPTRRAVVERLVDGPATVGELHDHHDMALPTFLKHLGVLERAGLVASEKRGRVRHVRLMPTALDDAETWFRSQRLRWQRRLDRMETPVRNLEEKSQR